MNGATCFIQLGRFGDLILLLPAFKAIHDRTGVPPVVVVSEEYASVLDGVTYVFPVPVACHWWQGMALARGIAEQFAEHLTNAVVIPQWWNSDEQNPVPLAARGQHHVRCHGKDFFLNLAEWPDFMTSMWKQCGLTYHQMMNLPVVFNRRNEQREWELVERLQGRSRKPLLLVNFTGVSSPFAAVPEYMRVINRFADRFKIIDLGKVQAHRIYDLLRLYDLAAGLITIDTATLHLAGAGNIEYVAFTRSDWSGSVPKGKCVLEIKYEGAEKQVRRLVPILERWAGCLHTATMPEIVGGGGGGILQI